jgi:hypothetical protein
MAQVVEYLSSKHKSPEFKLHYQKKKKRKKLTTAGENEQKKEPLYTFGGNAN